MTPVPIPQPPGLPFIGNIADIDAVRSIESFKALANKYGEIYRLNVPGASLVVATTHELVDDACDEKRFKKVPNNVLQQIRAGLGDGLFTAYIESPSWGIAHRVLMPAFGPMGIRDMFDEMKDVGTQLALKWARHGPHKRILAAQDFTRLTLDTIALCSMGYRFNSFYSEQMHPFPDAMTEFLLESGRRTQRLPLPGIFYKTQDAQFQAQIDVMRETAEEVLKERVADVGNQRKDLLAAMLKGRDPVTGEKMSDQSIIDNLITFLVAGHETTSGMLSYAMYRLIANPDEYRKVQREVDEVVGKGPITANHMSKLPYISAVLREALRLDSPIPIFGVCPLEDNTLLAGKYPVHKGEFVQCLLSTSHLDPKVFEDPLVFKPERMLDENFNKLPKNAWKPFGNGVRACIGRPFAWQEAVLVMAILFQNMKPDNFYMRAILRDGLDPVQLEHRLAGTEVPLSKLKISSGDVTPTSNGVRGQHMTVLYGSNSGTCENLAQRLAMDAVSHGYEVTTLDCMDAAVERLPKDQPIVVITASYEGQPPDNAAHFVSWISSMEDKQALRGSSYAVFGCGHHDWAQTFHRIPKLVDTKLEELGATRIADLGVANAAKEDMFVSFEARTGNPLRDTSISSFLPWDTTVKINGAGTRLPTNELVPAHSILSGFVELAQPATRRNVLALADIATSEADRDALKNLASESYDAEIIAKRVSILDLLETYPSIDLPLGNFLTMLPQMRVRQYSIASSPLADPQIASISFSLITGRANSGRGSYSGVASTYLDGLEAGDRLRVSVRPAHAAFHLPPTPEQTPLILVAAGTGIAPFRGFVQDRAAMVRAGRKVAPAVLYHGCREAGRDDLYAEELAEWEELGAVVVKRAFSRRPEESGGAKYVQDLLWVDRERFLDMWRRGAQLYVCGSRKMSKGVEKVVKSIRQENAKARGERLSDEDAQKWWDESRNVRYATDVFD